MGIEQQVAVSLVEIGAVGFSPERPVTFKSGLISPIYVDNRRIPFWPEAFQTVIAGFEAAIAKHHIEYEIIAGVESGGIPHSAALGYALRKPSVFVRKQPKEHGTRNRIEGGTVLDKRVLLVEDLVTTGGSSLASVSALREAGALVNTCLAIVSYEFGEAQEAFDSAGVRLYALTSLADILEAAVQTGRFGREAIAIIEDWLADPPGWAARHGFINS